MTTLLCLVSPPAAGGTPAPAQPAAEIYQAGMQLFADHKLDQAAPLFRQAAQVGCGYLGLCAWNMVGQVARLKGDATVALEAFAVVARDAPAIARSAPGLAARNASVLAELAVLYQAEILETQEKWDAALQQYEQLLHAPADAASLAATVVRDPCCRERIARLYWRVGRTDRTLEMLRAILADSADYRPAPLLRLVVLSLEQRPDGAVESKLAFLSAPLETIGLAAAGSSERQWQQTSPLLAPLQDLAAGLPEDSPSLPLLRLRCGWMLYEAGQFDSAREQFSLASSLADRLHVPAVKDYADLSLALWSAHHGEPDKAAQLAERIVASAGRGHAQEVATQIITSLSWYRDQQERARGCSVKPLK